MKKLYILGMSALLATGIVVVSCKKEEKKDTKTAANEYCACAAKSGEAYETCLEALQTKWEKELNDDVFLTEFYELIESASCDK
jgi:uncharacterized membrane protein